MDRSGNAWVANFSSATVTKMDSTGNPLSGSGFPTANANSSLAVDGDNTVWTANEDGSISRLSNDGTAMTPGTGLMAADSTAAIGIVVDASGNIWTTDAIASDSIFQYVGAAAPSTVPLVAAVKNGTIGVRP